MSDAEVVWRGVTLGGDSGFIVQDVSGWEDLPDLTSYDQSRSRGHGEHVGDLFSQGRTVTVTGKIADVSTRDEKVRLLQSVSTVSSAVEDLSIELMGIALTAGARIVRRSVGVGMNYAVGEVPFALQWRCPDPLRYGPELTAEPIGLPTDGGGLSYSLSYPLTYGASPVSGQIDLFNAGTAPAPVQFAVTGPLPGGFELSTTDGQRIVFEGPVSDGQVVTIDTATGMVLAEGTADRRGYITQADWIQVPAGGSTAVHFASLSGYDPAASLSVLRFRAAYW